MSHYICQIPHRSNPIAWFAATAASVIDKCETDETTFDTVFEAIEYDMAQAFWAETPFALFTILRHSKEVNQREKALEAVAKAFEGELAELASYDDDNEVHVAFDGQMTWDEAEETVNIGNRALPAATLPVAILIAHDELNANFTHVDR